MGKVLVVDDVSEMRDLLGKVLKTMHCAYIEASSGSEAIQAISDNDDVDIVLLDVGLGDVDGFEGEFTAS